MGETLIERRRVEDEGLRIVNSCHERTSNAGEQPATLIVFQEEGTANFVPAAAVIRRMQALSGFTGRKARAGGSLSMA
jgi:hypothetical protein